MTTDRPDLHTTFTNGCVVRVLTDDALSSLVLPDPPTAGGDECAGVWAAFGE